MFRPAVPEAGGIQWILVCHIVLLLMVAGVDRGAVWQPPSPAFIDHDIDRDHWVSREEWESRYGTSALNPGVLEFDWGDCDRDGRLAWQEYYVVSVSRRKCESSPLEAVLWQPGPSAQREEPATPVVSDRDLQLARVSLARSRQRLVAAKFHERYTEQDWPMGVLYRYTLTCGETEWVEIPELSQDFRRLSSLAALAQGYRPAIRCSVTNRSHYTLTYLRLRVSMAAEGGDLQGFHGKTLWVPPQESRDVWIFPDAGRPVTGVSLLAVRVKRD